MRLVKRFGLVVSIVSVVSVPLAAAAIASGGGLAPGDYVFTNAFARASFTSASGKLGPSFDVVINRGLNSFRPEDGDGPPTVANNTILSLFESSNSGGGGGCFVINPADFTVSKDVQSAAVHTTLTAADACPGFGAPVSAAGGALPLPGGGSGGLVLPIRVNVTWTGLGVTGTSRDVSTFTCGDFSTQSRNVSRSTGATATGSVSGMDGPFIGNFAEVASTNSHLEINGAPLPACRVK